jgi:hypothetical protein
MSAIDVSFAGSAVRIECDGAPAEQLAQFLFLNSGAGPADAELCPQVWFSMRCEEQQLHITSNQGDETRGQPAEVAYAVMERVTYHLADRSRGGALFHAACLASHGAALAFPGTSGSGKSTLALWLAQHGFRYLTDELLFIPSGSLACRGLARPVHLRKASQSLFDPFPADKILKAPDAGWVVQPEFIAAQANLRALVFPKYEQDTSFSCERIPAAEAALRLTGLMVNARNLPDNGFPELLRLARALPAYHLTYSQFEPMLPALQRILEQGAPPHP